MTREESPSREPNEPPPMEVGELRASRGATIVAADISDHAGRRDDVAGSEFVVIGSGYQSDVFIRGRAPVKLRAPGS